LKTESRRCNRGNEEPVLLGLDADKGNPQQARLIDTVDAFVSQLRWPGSQASRLTVLDSHFALGQRFLAAWLSWQSQAEPHAHLDFIALEAAPLKCDDLAALQAGLPYPQWAPLAKQLQAQWPILTSNLHLLTFEQGRVRLLLALGPAQACLRELTASVNTFVIDADFDARGCKALARLAAPSAALLVAHNSAKAAPLQAALRSAGFVVQSAQVGEAPFTLGRYQPSFIPGLAPGRVQAHRAAWGHAQQHAVIVGAGLAGCATALALSRQGWRCTVIDRHSGPAQATSGNAAGLFHGVVHGHDGTHARWGRAAALYAARWIQDALSEQAAPAGGHGMGEMRGLLRLQLEGQTVRTMRATLAQLGLPEGYVQALEASQASRLSGLSLAHAAWFYPQGGWIQPGPLCQHWLEASQAVFLGNTPVESIAQEAGLWQAMDSQGKTIAQAPVLVLANAHDALPLLHPWMQSADWTVEAVRGQISQLPLVIADALGLRAPQLPLAGAGYLLPRTAQGLLFGATSQRGDTDASVRATDHHVNLSQLEKLYGQALPAALWSLPQWQGRTGWRCMTKDRLPIVGAVPDPDMINARTHQPRLIPRIPGLHVCMGLGSRGITWAPLLAEVVASSITGAAMPLECSLLDALDPARFGARAVRQLSEAPDSSACPVSAASAEPS
jgi:tRNA 5-methylaminomethyl-2-thiouridine biosynthesis bifunctional protein